MPKQTTKWSAAALGEAIVSAAKAIGYESLKPEHLALAPTSLAHLLSRHFQITTRLHNRLYSRVAEAVQRVRQTTSQNAEGGWPARLGTTIPYQVCACVNSI